VDLNLPDGRAVEILTSRAEEGHFPIAIIASSGSAQIAVEAMKAGALDFEMRAGSLYRAMRTLCELATKSERP
jgi:FixJ family two-component response regulator